MDKTLMSPQEERTPQAYGALFEEMRQALSAVAMMLRTTNERMGALEEQVRLLTKVTPAQTRALHEMIRERAAELCRSYRAQGQEQKAANAIRKAVRLATGVTSIKDLPRCEYPVVMRQIQLWDDYRVMKGLKGKGGGCSAQGVDDPAEGGKGDEPQ